MGMLRRPKSAGRPDGGIWPWVDKPGPESPSSGERRRKRARRKNAKASRKRNRRR